MKDYGSLPTGVAFRKRKPLKAFCKLLTFIPLIFVSSMAVAVSPERDSMSLERMMIGALIDGFCHTLSDATGPLSLNERESIVRCAWFISERDKPANEVQPLSVWLEHHPLFSAQVSEQRLLAAWLALKGRAVTGYPAS